MPRAGSVRSEAAALPRVTGWNADRELPSGAGLLRGAVGPLQERFLVGLEDHADLAC